MPQDPGPGVTTPTLPLASCVTLAKGLPLSGPQRQESYIGAQGV